MENKNIKIEIDELLKNSELSKKEKISFLEDWKYDLLQRSIAESENMDSNSKESLGLSLVSKCLNDLKNN